jgi:hypothetical protein
MRFNVLLIFLNIPRIRELSREHSVDPTTLVAKACQQHSRVTVWVHRLGVFRVEVVQFFDLLELGNRVPQEFPHSYHP